MWQLVQGHAIRRSRALSMNRAEGHAAMALVAQRVDVRHVQHPGVLRTVRRVACQAAFRLDRSVLIDKRPAHIRVALGADHVLIDRRSQVVGLEGAVHVMAVGALDHAFVHRVMERHIELRLHVGVALEAERGLRSLEQRLCFAAVNAVATDAADVGLGVRRTRRSSGCAPAWQLRHLASTSLAEALAGSKILVTSPPPATCSLPGAMAVLAGDAIAFPCIRAILV